MTMRNLQSVSGAGNRHRMAALLQQRPAPPYMRSGIVGKEDFLLCVLVVVGRRGSRGICMGPDPSADQSEVAQAVLKSSK